MKIFLFVFIVLLLTQCERFPMDKRHSLYVKNYSDYSIIYVLRMNQETSTVYDTILGDNPPSIDHVTTILSGQNKALLQGSMKISSYFDNVPSDTISIYLFHIDTLKNNTWADVQAGYKTLKRYDLSLEDLEHLDYKLNYLPDAKMSGVKMYPPYP